MNTLDQPQRMKLVKKLKAEQSKERINMFSRVCNTSGNFVITLHWFCREKKVGQRSCWQSWVARRIYEISRIPQNSWLSSTSTYMLQLELTIDNS
jgi:hypothetical protein